VLSTRPELTPWSVGIGPSCGGSTPTPTTRSTPTSTRSWSSRDGGPPGRGDVGLQDNLDLAPYQQAAVLVRFTDHAGRFLLHCHNLEREDMAMMTTFTVTRKTAVLARDHP
jgi:Multicopper oxidase